VLDTPSRPAFNIALLAVGLQKAASLGLVTLESEYPRARDLRGLDGVDPFASQRQVVPGCPFRLLHGIGFVVPVHDAT
jgi:hypothetical protein